MEQYNSHLPHSALQGQTPDEMYFGRGEEIPDELTSARRKAMNARIEVNRNIVCEVCEMMGEPEFATAS